jgi:amino acid adenylation domain-containing protein
MDDFQFCYAASSQGENGAPLTLVSLIRKKVTEQPDTVIHTFLPDGEHEGQVRTFASLDKKARILSAFTQERYQEGERALLFFPPGLEFIDALFGCLYSGLVAVPAFPPNPSQREQTLGRLQALAFDSRASVILTTHAVESFFQPATATYPPLNQIPWVSLDQLPEEANSAWKEYTPDPDHLAYFQYTSGSTRSPHGVCLTHRNLVHNSMRIGEFFQLTPQDVTVSWLPMYHNLGLIGSVLQPFFTGVHGYLMPPQVFLENPLLWLKAITRYKATVCGGPNFAYDLCVLRIPPDKRQGLDLSSWKLAFNGAEAIHAATLKRFSASFAPYGFSESAFYPCYGLAEATLMVTGGRRGTGPEILSVDAAALETNQVRLAASEGQFGLNLVSNGWPFSDQELLIVNPDSRVPLPAGQVGEIWLKGPSVSPGYWNHPEETEETFHGYTTAGIGPYLRTGDLGFLHDQQCYITGRLKELIIIRGRNLYPQDIEQSILPCHPSLIPNGAAAFSVEVESVPPVKEEKLVIVQEIDPRKAPDLTEVVSAMRQAVTATYNVQLYGVALVEPGSIGRTISGKIQRRLTCKQYLEGSLKTLYAHELRGEPVAQAQQHSGEETGAAAVHDNLLRAALIALGPEKASSLLVDFLSGHISQILRIPVSSIDTRQSLASLGLDSISTIELVGVIQTTTGVNIAIEDISRGISLDELSLRIAELYTRSGAAGKAPNIPAAGNAESDTKTTLVLEPGEQSLLSYPLTYGQRALWFVQRLRPGDIAHNLVYAITMHTSLDAEAFRRSIRTTVERHPLLRARFSELDGQPVQTVYPAASSDDHFDFTVEDASAWPSDQLAGRMEGEVFKPFNLETGPLVRVSIFIKAPREFIVTLSLHHVITDLWSMAILAYEIIEVYAAQMQGRAPVLKELRGSFADAVHQEAEMLSSPQVHEHLTYWKERLAGDPTTLLLPTDHPRTATLSGRAASLSLDLAPQLIAALKALAARHNTNLFTTLLSAFYTLLYRYTGQTNFLLATPKAMRNRSNAAVVGYFINPVVLRTNLQETMTFSALLDQTNREIQADFQHEAIPFPLLVERMKPDRETGGNPLFQIFFSWQKTHRLMDSRLINGLTMNEVSGPFDVSGISISTYPLKARVTATDLALLVAESEDQLCLTVEYATDLFEPETIQRLLGHLAALLAAAVRDPDQSIAQVDLLTTAERSQLLEGWNPTVDESETEWIPLHAAILRQAEKAPNHPAVESGGPSSRSLNYRELANLTRAMAVRLTAEGAGPGKVIGLCAERSPELIAGLLAILYTGSAYLPLDPDYPAERLAFMLEDSGAAVILTHSGLVNRLPGSKTPIVLLDGEFPAFTSSQSAPVRPDDPAYIMYTSGSTGQPKGVLVPHLAIARHCYFMKSYYEMTPADRMLQFASLNFDASLEQIFTTLISGATLVLRDNNLWNPGDFSQKISDQRLTVVNVPPAYWNQWTESDRKCSPSEPVRNPQLRLVIVGGDVMRPETLRDWHETASRSTGRAVRLINAYGPTEAVITACAYDVPNPLEDCEALQAGSRIPIGRPLAGRSAYILDAYQQPVPVGIPGELYIGGECLALGYWKRPELTQERFVPNRFNTGSKAQLYRTGDLARFLPDSNIEFLGRMDRQIKVLGIRIEPAEIEAALKQHPRIQNAIVVHMPGINDRLIACLSTQGEPPKPAELTAFLARRLPQYMIPADFAFLDELPLTPSGKLDRDALSRAVLWNSTTREDSFIAPRNDIEAYLAGLWSQLLCVEKVGIRDNFFALGGHSLLATQVMARLRSRYGVDIPLRDLFEAPTVENLASAVVQALASQEDDEDLKKLLNEIEDR